MKPSHLVASLVSPLAGPLVYTTCFLLFFPDTSLKGERTLGALLIAMLFFVPASYIASIIFGAPLILGLRRLGKLSFWAVVLTAFPCGILAFALGLLVLTAFGATVEWSGMLPFLVVGGVVGSSIAAAYSYLAGITSRSRPTR